MNHGRQFLRWSPILIFWYLSPSLSSTWVWAGLTDWENIAEGMWYEIMKKTENKGFQLLCFLILFPLLILKEDGYHIVSCLIETHMVRNRARSLANVQKGTEIRPSVQKPAKLDFSKNHLSELGIVSSCRWTIRWKKPQSQPISWLQLRDRTWFVGT